MTSKLLIIRGKDLSVTDLHSLKDNDEVFDLRIADGYIMAMVSEKFKTHLTFLDIEQVFSVLVDGQLKISVDLSEDQWKELQSAIEYNVSYNTPPDLKTH